MKLSAFVDILGAIATVALVTTIVAHPASKRIIAEFGNAFESIFVEGIKAALGGNAKVGLK